MSSQLRYSHLAPVQLQFPSLLPDLPRRRLHPLPPIVDLGYGLEIGEKFGNPLSPELVQRLLPQRPFLSVEGGAAGGGAVVDALDHHLTGSANWLAHRTDG